MTRAVLSLATNVCVTDLHRIRQVLPHWLRVFDRHMSELVVVVDTTPPSGRIAQLHRNKFSIQQILGELEQIKRQDQRVRSVALSTDRLPPVSCRWFTSRCPLRGQEGTPIFAFIAAIDEAKGPCVLRMDCDMLVFDNGWVEEAVRVLESDEADLVSPARVSHRDYPGNISTQIFALHKPRFYERRLPMTPHRLGLVRRLHRALQGRSSWLALETMFEIERARGGLRFQVLDGRLGNCMHVHAAGLPGVPGFGRVVCRIERGDIPRAQCEGSLNYLPECWSQ